MRQKGSRFPPGLYIALIAHKLWECWAIQAVLYCIEASPTSIACVSKLDSMQNQVARYIHINMCWVKWCWELVVFVLWGSGVSGKLGWFESAFQWPSGCSMIWGYFQIQLSLLLLLLYCKDEYAWIEYFYNVYIYMNMIQLLRSVTLKYLSFLV